MALDSLASELETLRTHWETTNKNYRISTNYDYDDRPVLPKLDIGAHNGEGSATGGGLSISLADWRKRLDQEEEDGQGSAGNRKGSESATSPTTGTGAMKREMSPSGKEVGAGGSQVNLI